MELQSSVPPQFKECKSLNKSEQQFLGDPLSHRSSAATAVPIAVFRLGTGIAAVTPLFPGTARSFIQLEFRRGFSMRPPSGV